MKPVGHMVGNQKSTYRASLVSALFYFITKHSLKQFLENWLRISKFKAQSEKLFLGEWEFAYVFNLKYKNLYSYGVIR